MTFFLLLIVVLLTKVESRYGRANTAHTFNASNTNFIDALSQNYFPKRPPKRIRMRTDETGAEVQKGRLDLLGGLSDFVSNRKGKWNDKNESKVSFKVFKRILQCTPHEPGLNQVHGILSLMSMYPVGVEVIETAAVLADTTTKSDHHNCLDYHGRVNWRTCLNQANQLKQGNLDPNNMRNINTNVRLVRLLNGRLYFDWPWSLPESKHYDRNIRTEYNSQWSFLRLLGGALEKINDIPDSVFLTVTFDYPFLPPFFPLPAISNAPKITNSELPYPFTLLINDEILFYNNYITKLKNNLPVEDLHENVCKKEEGCGKDLNPDNDYLWSKRINKAAFFGALFFSSISTSRQIVIDLSARYPDLIVANFSKEVGASYHHPYVNRDQQNKRNANINTNKMTTDQLFDNYLNSISDHKLKGVSVSLVNDYMAKYKYLLVLGGISVSERLATFLSHSGAVILLQESDTLYHFSPRLKPWVHYVPVSYTAAEIVNTIKWLQQNDDIARTIARNGYIFGQSYLRLEDYYCYAAQILYSFGQVVTPEALKPFNKKRKEDLFSIPPSNN